MNTRVWIRKNRLRGIMVLSYESVPCEVSALVILPDVPRISSSSVAHRNRDGGWSN